MRTIENVARRRSRSLREMCREMCRRGSAEMMWDPNRKEKLLRPSTVRHRVVLSGGLGFRKGARHCKPHVSSVQPYALLRRKPSLCAER